MAGAVFGDVARVYLVAPRIVLDDSMCDEDQGVNLHFVRKSPRIRAFSDLKLSILEDVSHETRF